MAGSDGKKLFLVHFLSQKFPYHTRQVSESGHENIGVAAVVPRSCTIMSGVSATTEIVTSCEGMHL